MKFLASILEYLGTIDDGIVVLIAIVYDNKYYEGTFYYTAEDILLTVADTLENDLGHKITDNPEYINLLRDILRQIAPYNEMYSKLSEINFDKWIKSQITVIK